MAEVAAGSAKKLNKFFLILVLSFFQIVSYDLVGFREFNELKLITREIMLNIMGRAINKQLLPFLMSYKVAMSLEYMCRTLSKPQLLEKSISEVTVN